MSESKTVELDQIRAQIIGVDEWLHTPYGRRRMVYADYTASGRGLYFIENYLIGLQKRYANSHTEDDTTGRETTALLRQAETQIKLAVNAGENGRIILCGSGATAAIDRMQQVVGVKLPAASRATIETLLEGFLGRKKPLHKLFGRKDAHAFSDYCQQSQPVVFVGPYEHHSNEVSWREGLATVVEVNLTPDGQIDLAHLEALLQMPQYQHRIRIGSFSAASNVTGIKSPVHELAALLHRHDALAFIDYAASAPYVSIDMNPESTEGVDRSLDAIFVSPHKFVGGPGSCGLLVFNKRCYQSDLSPSIAGGGTVDYVGPVDHDFVEDIEVRESAGTPAILQAIKAALVFEVKKEIGEDVIEARERALIRRVMQRWQSHPNIEILGNPVPENRVGICSFNIKAKNGQYLHPRFVTTLLDDLFGIQSRAGCSCAGPYGHALLEIDQSLADEYRAVIAEGVCGIKPGWCRIGFHYLFDDSEANYIIDAVVFVAEFGHLFMPHYRFSPDTGVWDHKAFERTVPRLSLSDAFQAQSLSATPVSEKNRMEHYRDNLRFANEYAAILSQQCESELMQLKGEAGKLQFFALSEGNVS